MIKWCAYCQEFQGETPEFDNYAISHGLCSACKARGFNISDEEFEKINQLKAIQKILFDAGFSQDAKAVDEAIKTAQAAGVKPVDLLMGLVGPLLWTVGDLWAAGKITHEDENRFTTFFDAIIARIENHDLKNQSPGARRRSQTRYFINE